MDVPHDDPASPSLGLPADRLLLSCHAAAPLSPDALAALWAPALGRRAAHVKHVEPLGAPRDFPRLLAARSWLEAAFPGARVTVLAMGPCALPFRAILAEDNALDYLALGPDFLAAPGQRLLADAVRASRSPRAPSDRRLGILGTLISGSRSPSIHPRPFDRIDLPADTPLSELLEALRPWYRGFAVTSPFKQGASAATRSEWPAVNTLVRTRTGYHADNTDLHGAREVLRHLGAARVEVLGDGGSTVALRAAASELGVQLSVRTRATAVSAPFSHEITAIWTWPPHLAPPEGLALSGARVAILAYGERAREVAAHIRRCGGRPVRLGYRWFTAQARAQRALWEDAT